MILPVFIHPNIHIGRLGSFEMLLENVALHCCAIYKAVEFSKSIDSTLKHASVALINFYNGMLFVEEN